MAWTQVPGGYQHSTFPIFLDDAGNLYWLAENYRTAPLPLSDLFQNPVLPAGSGITETWFSYDYAAGSAGGAAAGTGIQHVPLNSMLDPAAGGYFSLASPNITVNTAGTYVFQIPPREAAGAGVTGIYLSVGGTPVWMTTEYARAAAIALTLAVSDVVTLDLNITFTDPSNFGYNRSTILNQSFLFSLSKAA